MKARMHRFILHNEEIHEASEKLISLGQIGFVTGWGVFSTIKVIDGVLFAFERHWARMAKDAARMRVPLPPDAIRVENSLLRLVERNGASRATLRINIARNKGGLFEGPAITRPCDVVAFTADIQDWGDSVKLDYVRQGRHAASPFAGVKVLSWGMNLTMLEEAKSRGLDEVILLNERDEVAECTSANIFVAKDGVVWTPPLSSGCLPGVTRELLLSEVSVAGTPVTERTLTPADLESADQIFISSTTRDLLPVASIGGKPVSNTGAARDALQTGFSKYVDQYVASHKRQSATIR